MPETKLTKRYRLVWDADTKKIVMQGESVIWTGKSSFEADTRGEIEAKIGQLKLKEPKKAEAAP